MLVRQVSSARRSSSGPSTARALPVHRHFGFQLGCLPRQRPAVRLVVSRLFSVFLPILRHQSVSFRGQHDSFVLPQKSRGYPFLHSELRCSGRSSSLRGQSGSSGSPVCSGSPACPHGFSQSLLPGFGLEWTLCHQVIRELLRCGRRPSTCLRLLSRLVFRFTFLPWRIRS